MTFADDHRDLLAALRDLSLPTYVALMRSCHSPEEYAAAVAAVSDHATSSQDEPTPDLTRLLSSSGYRDFLAHVLASSPDHAPRVQQVLETAEYEARLARLKAQSLQEYLDELRVVSPEEVAHALVNGTIVNAWDTHGEPLRIRSDEQFSAAFLETPTATAYVDAATLTRVLVDFAAGAGDAIPNPQGLRLRGVVIGGELNLNWLQLPFALGFEGCDFHHWISADHLSVPWLSFDSCDFTPWGQAHRTGAGAVNASSITVTSSLRFWGCRGLGQLFIPDARIGDFSPTNPHVPEGEAPETFRTVIDGAWFGRLGVPVNGESLPFQLSRSVRVETLEFAESSSPAHSHRADAERAARLHSWLADVGTEAPEAVWSELEAALRRSGMERTATEFGVLGARERTRSRRLGWIARLTLGPTVRYFYDNLRAIWWLIALYLLTLGCAFGFAESFVQSPMSNPSSLPDSWWESMLDRAVWAMMYAADTVLSPVSLGQADTVWPESSLMTLFFATIKGLSLLLLGLLIIGVTGLAERRGMGSDS